MATEYQTHQNDTPSNFFSNTLLLYSGRVPRGSGIWRTGVTFFGGEPNHRFGLVRNDVLFDQE